MKYVKILSGTLLIILACLLHTACWANEQEDTKLAQAVRDRLACDENINNLFVRVEVVDARAILSGRILSADEKELAEKIAKQTRGIKEVQNDLEVRPLDSSDAQELKMMKARIREISQYKGLPGEKSGVYSNADRRFEKQKKETETEYKKNLQRADSQVASNIKAAFSDRELKRSVENAIRYAALRGRTDNITAVVSNGHVMIFGTVDNPYDQRDIVDIVKRLPGVVDVDDHTTINR